MSDEQRFDLLILDRMLPGRDGLEILEVPPLAPTKARMVSTSNESSLRLLRGSGKFVVGILIS